MVVSKDGQGLKDKYMDISRKILLREMLMYNMEAFSILSLRSYDFNWSNVQVKRLSTYKKVLSQGILM